MGRGGSQCPLRAEGRADDAALEKARPLIEGGDWLHYVDLREQWERAIPDQSCACAALDIAILDWVGRKLNVPLYRLFGLDASKTPVTTFSIGIDTPEVIKQKVKEAKDFPVLKIKVGTENDAQIVTAVREATDQPLRVDANEGWHDKEQALEKIQLAPAHGRGADRAAVAGGDDRGDRVASGAGRYPDYRR